jgi:3-oxocholest-4-en-26-oate---CoA ligase
MSSMDVNLADLIGAVADALPDRCALVCDGDRLSYRQLMHRASHLAQHLIAAGLRPDETAGLYMPNSAAYVESLLACMLARLIPVNINYRYTGSELAHLFTAGKQALRLVSAEKATALVVIGDAMARPIADELAAHPGEYNLSSLVVLGSGAALLSRSVREQIQAMCPNLLIIEAFGSSESGNDSQLGQGEDGQRRVVHRGNVTVLDEALRPVGPGGIGQIARSGHVPLGYYGDEAATKATFPVIGGVRWALLGDMAEVDRDSSIIFLGRGSMCINTGGEKVYPEEVEQVLKAHPAVMDALVAGIPDERFGERVAAVVALRPGAAADTDALREHCRGTLAGYKVPARIRFVAQVTRSPSGKADYRWARAVLAGPEPAPSGPP